MVDDCFEDIANSISKFSNNLKGLIRFAIVSGFGDCGSFLDLIVDFDKFLEEIVNEEDEECYTEEIERWSILRSVR